MDRYTATQVQFSRGPVWCVVDDQDRTIALYCPSEQSARREAAQYDVCPQWGDQ